MTAAWNYIKMEQRRVGWPAHSAVQIYSSCRDLKMWMVLKSQALDQEHVG